MTGTQLCWGNSENQYKTRTHTLVTPQMTEGAGLFVHQFLSGIDGVRATPEGHTFPGTSGLLCKNRWQRAPQQNALNKGQSAYQTLKQNQQFYLLVPIFIPFPDFAFVS